MTEKPSARRVLKVSAIGGLIAGLINVLLLWLSKAAGVDYLVKIGGESVEISAAQPFFASLIGLLLGALLAVIVVRWRNAETIWLAVVGVAFIVETGSAFVQATGLGTAILLTIMHVVVVAAALRFTRPFVRPIAAGQTHGIEGQD
ncbi:MAG: DUF6069 family protein [Angustibacter sp.]